MRSTVATYAALQTPRAQEVGLFRRVLGGLSCREYEAAAEAVPEAFGLARSSVSRRFIRASARELRRLKERRLDDAEWLVLVLDGSKGLRAAVRDVCGAGAQVQRCQWHKRENVVSYLAKQDQPVWRRKLQAAWAHPTHADAKRALDRLYRELRLLNESAAASLADH